MTQSKKQEQEQEITVEQVEQIVNGGQEPEDVENEVKMLLTKGEISAAQASRVLKGKQTLEDVKEEAKQMIDGSKPKKQGTKVPKERKPSKLDISLTTEEVFDKAREAIASGDEGANRYNTWAVMVDGKKVAPKWLVSLLTGASAKDFDAVGARAALKRVGIEAVPVEKPKKKKPEKSEADQRAEEPSTGHLVDADLAKKDARNAKRREQRAAKKAEQNK